MGREAASILRRKRRTDLGQGEGLLENLRGWVGESDTILLKVLSGCQMVGKSGDRDRACQKHCAIFQARLFGGLGKGTEAQETGSRFTGRCPSEVRRTWAFLMGISRRQEEEDHSDAGSGAWRRAWWECLLWAGVLLCFWGFLSEWSSVSISFSDPGGG